jgi:integrase
MLGRNNRKVVRLGKVPMRIAEEVQRRIELLATSAETKTSPDRETTAWASGLESTLYDRLAKLRLVPKRATPEQATLGAFLANYISIRTDIKPATLRSVNLSRRKLEGFFGVSKPLEDVTEGDADEFRLMLAKTLKQNSIRLTCVHSRQFFQAAVKRRLIASNPFGEMKSMSPTANKAREYFVSRTDAEKVLDACPDAQWRLVFSLARFGGLRCPSEFGLRWSDVDWARGRMTIHSPKTERHEGKDERTIPIFPELRPYLEAAWEQAEAGAEFIVPWSSRKNLGWSMAKIVRSAGLTPWPKLFQNMRSTRETELAEQFPIHVVCAWMGNSKAVATKHYLQVTDGHFEAAQKAAQLASVSVGKSEQPLPVICGTADENRGIPTSTLGSSFSHVSGGM